MENEIWSSYPRTNYLQLLDEVVQHFFFFNWDCISLRSYRNTICYYTEYLSNLPRINVNSCIQTMTATWPALSGRLLRGIIFSQWVSSSHWLRHGCSEAHVIWKTAAAESADATAVSSPQLLGDTQAGLAPCWGDTILREDNSTVSFFSIIGRTTFG